MNTESKPEWARSAKGKSIALYQSHPQEQLQRPILLIGGVHGDEPEGVDLATLSLEWLQADAQTNHSVETPWIVIPCLNIDGYEANTRVNGNGVDLNRNYPSENWSAEFEKERYFPGPSAGSEPEIQALTSLIGKVQPRIIIHCHSWEPCVVCTGALGQKDAQRLAKSSGYKLVDTIGYPTSGSLSQYGWYDHGIPVLCIEEAEGTSKEQTWKNFSKAIKEIFRDPSPRVR